MDEYNNPLPKQTHGCIGAHMKRKKTDYVQRLSAKMRQRSNMSCRSARDGENENDETKKDHFLFIKNEDWQEGDKVDKVVELPVS